MSITFEFLQERHLPQIREWHRDPETFKRLTIPPVEDWFKFVSSRLDYFVLAASENDELIGEVMVELIEYKRASIAFVVSPTHRCKGYGKRMLASIITHAILTEINEIEAWVDEDHIGSIKCLEAAGFTIDETEDQLVRYLYKR
ncbi:GNAT family N-acetyltransferase [Paenibacillus sp. PR3]|uniref:GNAT family N-acetyltransferase n=1 Tax=Paenibacillus terricola TaxID=2763503 RepID=A0ABR8N1S9_9BACL|nr:GNAT family N-acetyltransferase [Paenibacillus terricola]MBD3922136.1 GNAT family N-acetyltransferase [Paenibacillus terricola]